jgi:PmbA protein
MPIEDRSQLARDIVDLALSQGASAAEVLVREGTEFSASVRLGSVEKLLQSSFRKLGMRIFDGVRAASSATSDFASETLRSMVSDTLSMARAGSSDPANGLPEPELYRTRPRPMTLSFPAAGDLTAEEKIELARRCEIAALQFDPRINNSEGAGFTDSAIQITYANSLDIHGSYRKTTASLHAVPLAESNGQKQRDHWLSTQLDLARLESPENIGREAARRTLRRLGARKVSTTTVPVVFDPLTAGTLLSYVADALSGTALLRKASFLMDRLGERIASDRVTIRDDALREGGLGSRPFDSEGVPSQTTTVVEDGILRSYLLDAYSARKLGLQSTGSSARELTGPVKSGPSNFYLEPGDTTPESIIGEVKNGLYVTEVIGFGVNVVTGDYSQGAAGLWIDNGELAYPVEEITIAGNLKEMLTTLEAVGNDLIAVAPVFAPTILIGRMVVSGN